jgi:hypothetical protein
MSELPPTTGLSVADDRPLVGLPSRRNGREVVRYFTEDTNAPSPLPEDVLRRARAAYGSWKGLDWQETLGALDRIREENEPTPPVDLEL